jgi:plastocyanin
VPAVRVATIGRLLLIAIVGVAAIALTSALAAPAASDARGLVIRTGPGFKMKLTRAGREVDYVRAGKQKITIHDTSRSHSVQLLLHGRRYPDTTLSSLRFVGTKTVTVTFGAAGTRYNIVCRRHGDKGMHDSFITE